MLFSKDPDPLGPNYFVFCDSLAEPADAAWRLWLTCSDVTLNGAAARVEGTEDVDTDVFFAQPATPQLKTETIARTSGSGISPTGQQGPTTTTQTGVIAEIHNGDTQLVVVYPRLKSQPPAVVTTVADGKGVKVETETGTDYLFVSKQRFQFHQGDLTFDGTAGAIQVRPNGTFLSLGAAGRIAFGEQSLEAPAAATGPVEQ